MNNYNEIVMFTEASTIIDNLDYDGIYTEGFFSNVKAKKQKYDNMKKEVPELKDQKIMRGKTFEKKYDMATKFGVTSLDDLMKKFKDQLDLINLVGPTYDIGFSIKMQKIALNKKGNFAKADSDEIKKICMTVSKLYDNSKARKVIRDIITQGTKRLKKNPLIINNIEDVQMLLTGLTKLDAKARNIVAKYDKKEF